MSCELCCINTGKKGCVNRKCPYNICNECFKRLVIVRCPYCRSAYKFDVDWLNVLNRCIHDLFFSILALLVIFMYIGITFMLNVHSRINKAQIRLNKKK
jgi:hypothetical protein